MTERTLLQHHAASQFARWMQQDLEVAADEVVTWLREIVPHYNPSNRFEMYRRLLKSPLSIPRGIGAQRLLAEACRGVLDVFHIMRAARLTLPPPLDRIRLLIGGRSGDCHSADSTPWDVQFELLSKTILTFAGLADVTFAEPDLVVPAGDAAMGFAVKRITSDKRRQLRRRLVESIMQLSSLDMRGMLLIEIAIPAWDLASRAEPVMQDIMNYLRDEALKRDTDQHLTGFLLVRLQWIPPTMNSPGAAFDIASKLQLLHVPEGEEASLLQWFQARGSTLLERLVIEHSLLRQRIES